MALEDILKKIEFQAEGEGRKILDQARAEGEKKLAGAKDRGQEAAKRITGQGEAEAARLKRQAGAEANLSSRKALLARKREWLARATESAFEKLLSDEKVYREVLLTMLDNYFDKKTSALTFSGDDMARKIAREWSSGKGKGFPGLRIKHSSAGEEPRGGVILERGRVIINLSFRRLLEEMADREQVRIQKILFGGNNE